MKQTSLVTTSLLLACLTLAGCSKPDQSAPADSDSSSGVATAIGKTVRKATAKAQAKLATQNIGVSSGDSNLPKAEISPQGDLLIDGKRIAIDEAQRALLLKHRANVVAVAEAGIEIGVQGADLGAKAAGEALKGIFSGNTDQIERRVEAEADKIKAAALKLCDLLPPMQASQQALAAAVPEFVPYATMDQSDIDDCRSDQSGSYDAGKDVGRALGRLTKDPESAHKGTDDGDAAARADAAATQH